MNYLDRYLMTAQGRHAKYDLNAYQLATMTALYVAVKIHEAKAMDPTLVSMLSRGAYPPEDIEATEASLLAALQWRLHPPTSLSFVRCYLGRIPLDLLDEQLRRTVYENTKYQTELAITDPDLVGPRASDIALSSLLSSLQSIFGHNTEALDRALKDVLSPARDFMSVGGHGRYLPPDRMRRTIQESPTRCGYVTIPAFAKARPPLAKKPARINRRTSVVDTSPRCVAGSIA